MNELRPFTDPQGDGFVPDDKAQNSKKSHQQPCPDRILMPDSLEKKNSCCNQESSKVEQTIKVAAKRCPDNE